MAKYSGKPEVYIFLAFDVSAYVPPYDNVTVWYLRDMACGKRTRFKTTEIKTINIPQFEGLTIERMMYHAKSSQEIMKALP